MPESAHTSNTEIDYSRKWYVMSAVAMGIFLATIDGSIVNVALPTLVEELSTNFATVQWVVLAYLLTLATLLLLVGRLADIHGKKRIYMAGFVVFTIGSVLCGLSQTVYMLIAMRVVQAVGAAMVLALGPALITEAFPGSERGKALGIAGAIVSIGIIAGPTIGGVLIEQLSWHWIFFVNVPIGLLGTLMAYRFVHNIPPSGERKFDYWGALTLFISLLSLLLALTLGQEQGFTSAPMLALFATWLIFLAAFIVVELRTRVPMVDLRLFRNTLFSVNLSTGFLTFMAISGTIILLPFYLQNGLGYNVQTVGLMLAVLPVALGITSPIAGSISDRVGVRPVTITGLILLVIGYMASSTLSQETTLAGYILRLIPIGVGMGIFQSPNNSAIMGAAPRSQLGVASSLLAVTRTLGQTTGIAIFGAVWAARALTYSGGTLVGGATKAAPAVQVAALQDTYRVIAVLMLFGLGLAVTGAWYERRVGRKTAQVGGETVASR